MTTRGLAIGLTALLIAGAMTACGGDDPMTTPTDPPTTDPPTTSEGPDIEVGADPASPFVMLDGRLVVSLGGDVYRRTGGPDGLRNDFTAAAPAMAPNPPEPVAWEVAALTETGRQALIDEMDELGFLDPPPDYGDYEVTDTNTFDLTVRFDGQSYDHQVFDLDHRYDGDDDEADEALERLEDFVDFLDDIETELDDEIGEFEAYLPTEWRIDDVPTDDGDPWRFTEPTAAGCTDFAGDFPTADGTDGASGRYRIDENRTVDVTPLLPWEEC